MVKNLLLKCFTDDTRRSNDTDQIYRQSARAWVYSGATLTRTRWTKKHGLEAQIRFQPPADLQRKTLSQRRRWWNATKRLEEGMLFCSITFCIGKGTTLFFTVSETNTDSQNEYSLITENEPVISGNLTAATTIHDLMALAASFQGPNGLLVEFPGVILANFVPVLENLQKLLFYRRSALRKWFLEPGSGIPKPFMPPSPPRSSRIYARLPGFTFDLSPVITDPTISVYFGPGANTARMEENLNHLTTLDQG